MLPYNIPCEGCRRPITLFPTWDEGRVKWRAFDRPIPYEQYRHNCPEYRALRAQPIERRVLPNYPDRRRNFEPPRPNLDWPERRPTYTRRKGQWENGLLKFAGFFAAALAVALIRWITHN
jgi:hypothetical protein